MILEPVHSIELSEIRAARERIAKTIVRTPLIRLELGPEFPEIRLKLENLHPINAYKLRGAANAVAMLPEADRKRGVWTIALGMPARALRMPRGRQACRVRSLLLKRRRNQN